MTGRDYKVIICMGSGGVGKTTISACLGMIAAQAGKKVLVLTIDPAKRLATALGLGEFSNSEVVVPGEKLGGRLFASMVHPTLVFDEFVRRAATSPEAAERLLKNRLYLQLSRALSGSQEFTSLARVLTAVDSGKYDLVIVDTPPNQNAIDFLRAPQRIFGLFQDSITRWFSGEGGGPGFIQKIINRGTTTVLSALELVTGGQFIRELADFFSSISSMQKKVSAHSERVRELLTSSNCAFVMVTGFDEAKLREAKEFYQTLDSEGYHLVSVIVNRFFPDWLQKDGVDNFGPPEIYALYQQIQKYFAARTEVFNDFEAVLKGQVEVIKIPEFADNVYGLDGLNKICFYLKKGRVFQGDKR